MLPNPQYGRRGGGGGRGGSSNDCRRSRSTFIHTKFIDGNASVVFFDRVDAHVRGSSAIPPVVPTGARERGKKKRRRRDFVVPPAPSKAASALEALFARPPSVCDDRTHSSVAARWLRAYGKNSQNWLRNFAGSEPPRRIVWCDFFCCRSSKSVRKIF